MARQLVFDYRVADLPDNDRALCDYAIKLTLAPGTMDDRDIDGLHKHGFTDAQITVATQVIAYFNYITRVAQGLGVDRETWMNVPYDEWQRNKGNEYLGEL